MVLNPRKYKEFDGFFAEYIGCTKNKTERYIFPDGTKMAINMHFHDRWDWLMMVVEKISGYRVFEFGTGACVNIISPDGNDITSSEEKTLLLNVYNVCYQHIKKIKDETKTEHCTNSSQQA